jgi:hypothetical protein
MALPQSGKSLSPISQTCGATSINWAIIGADTRENEVWQQRRGA